MVFTYFDNTQTKSQLASIVTILKSQGHDICRNQIDDDYIKNAIASFKFGFVSMGLKASIGQIRRGSPQKDFHMSSFVICKEKAYSTDILSVELLCARPGLGHGKQLMNVVKEHARELGYKILILSALGDEALLDYYKALGFKLDQTLYLKNEVKCYNMYFIL